MGLLKIAGAHAFGFLALQGFVLELFSAQYDIGPGVREEKKFFMGFVPVSIMFFMFSVFCFVV